MALIAMPDGFTYWTRTVWTDVAAMRRFMATGAHSEAMPMLRVWCDEASVVHWEQDEPTFPDWAEAQRRMQADGRVSRVDHPSPAQEAFRVPAPVLDG